MEEVEFHKGLEGTCFRPTPSTQGNEGSEEN